MRQPHPELELYITGKANVPACGGDVDDIIDCTPEGCRGHAHMAKVLHLPPTGGNDHQWEMTDLDDIVELVIGCLEKGRIVLIHCNRGVSRSTTAACAVLLALGKARNVPEAISRPEMIQSLREDLRIISKDVRVAVACRRGK